MNNKEFVLEIKGERVECKCYHEPTYFTWGAWVVFCKLSNGEHLKLQIVDNSFTIEDIKKFVETWLIDKVEKENDKEGK